MDTEYLVVYWWIVRQERIQIAGYFTNTTWDWFCKHPHPSNKGVTIIEDYRIERSKVN